MGFHGSDGGNGKAAVSGADEEKVRETSVDVVTDDEHEDEVEDVAEKIHLGSRSSIKEQLEKDKDDESLRIFARGAYSARTKFFDDDMKCYLEINYSFDIRKDWHSAQ